MINSFDSFCADDSYFERFKTGAELNTIFLSLIGSLAAIIFRPLNRYFYRGSSLVSSGFILEESLFPDVLPVFGEDDAYDRPPFVSFFLVLLISIDPM